MMFRVYLVDPGSEVNISAAKVMNNEEFIENEFVVATMITEFVYIYLNILDRFY